MGGLVELDGALGILAEHAVDDTDVEVEVRVQTRWTDGSGRRSSPARAKSTAHWLS